MLESFNQHGKVVFTALFAAVLAGCAGTAPKQEPKPTPPDTQCMPAAQGDALIGAWLSVRKHSGVSGQLKTFFDLRADGTMEYAEQLTRPSQPPQGLSEKGCWRREGNSLVLRTLESNGSPVDADDPIYVNRYTLTGQAGDRLKMQSPEGVKLEARRMSPGYRLGW
jgi:hypothetical protein